MLVEDVTLQRNNPEKFSSSLLLGRKEIVEAFLLTFESSECSGCFSGSTFGFSSTIVVANSIRGAGPPTSSSLEDDEEGEGPRAKGFEDLGASTRRGFSSSWPDDAAGREGTVSVFVSSRGAESIIDDEG